MTTLMRPRTHILVAAARAPLVLPVTPISVDTPVGSDFRLDYILASYNRTVVAGAQTSPDLLFMLFDSRGVAMTNQPVKFEDVLTKAGAPRIWGVSRIGHVYPPRSVIRMEVTGMNAGPVPADISITYLGVKDWGRR